MAIMYVCDCCAEHSSESCGNDRDMLRVLPDGTWLCVDCFSGDIPDLCLVKKPPLGTTWDDLPMPPEYAPKVQP